MALRVAITGAAGRMGRELCNAIVHRADLDLVAALERPMSAVLGVDIGELAGCSRIGVPVSDDLTAVIDTIDVVIDFSSPAATVRNAELCAAQGVPIVIGTTGLTATQRNAVDQAASRIPLCMASNYSTGVTLCLKLTELAAQVLAEEFDAEIIEAHHRHKVDAPSGTALSLGHAVAAGRGQQLEDVAVYARQGQTGARPEGAIGFASLRGGDIVGDHTVLFAGDGERVEIGHRAGTRAAFARGALRAAVWLPGQAPGVYDMQDVLGLRTPADART